jgi:hypothetical protein
MVRGVSVRVMMIVLLIMITIYKEVLQSVMIFLVYISCACL